MSATNSQASDAGSLRSMLRRVAILSSGTTLSHVLLFALSPLLSRLFTPASFAVFGFHQAALAVLALLMTLQYDAAIPLPKDDGEARWLLGLALRIGGMIAGALTLAALGWGFTPWANLLWLPAAILILLPLCALGEAVARSYRLMCVRHGHFPAMSQARVIQAAVMGTSHVVTGCLGWITLGLPLGDALGRWVSAAWFVWSCRSSKNAAAAASTVVTPPSIDWPEFRRLLCQYARFPVFVTPGVVLALLINVFPSLLLPWLYGDQFAGQFALANRSVLMPLLIISQAVTHVYVSDAAKCVRHRNADLRLLIRRTAWQMGAGGLLLAGTAAVTGPLLFPIVFGPQWHVAGEIVPLLAISAFGQFVGGPVNQILVLLGKETRKLMLHLAGLLGVGMAFLGSAWLGLGPIQATGVYASTILVIQGMYLWQSLVMVEEQVGYWEVEANLAGTAAQSMAA
ncbi:MAG: oligosaccharide flippase family protein [Planctomycetaceae bacterium]|nr:oligosaccharide flippase family protein [Planctomycetaceae bacterium]